MGMGLYDLMEKQAVVADGKAIVRERVDKIDGVSRAWFGWLSRDSMMAKTLVVEIEYDTDPNNDRFRQSVIDAIYETVDSVLKDETTMTINHLRIVPPKF
jgi:hypothetical protein